MSTIAEIVAKGRGTAGSGGSWRVERIERDDQPTTLQLWHYAHRMLMWREDQPEHPDWLDYSTGWGSVSDQGGMNQAFRALDLPLYYSRQGGAEIRAVQLDNASQLAPTYAELAS